jgi:hypothetical protein
MSVTEFHSEVQHWRTGEVIRLSWGYEGKVVRAVLLAKNGARYVPPPPPDDPLVAYLMSDFGMKVGAARLLARRVPKKAADGRELTPEERIRAVHRLYEKGGAV